MDFIKSEGELKKTAPYMGSCRFWACSDNPLEPNRHQHEKIGGRLISEKETLPRELWHDWQKPEKVYGPEVTALAHWWVAVIIVMFVTSYNSLYYSLNFTFVSMPLLSYRYRCWSSSFGFSVFRGSLILILSYSVLCTWFPNYLL